VHLFAVALSDSSDDLAEQQCCGLEADRHHLHVAAPLIAAAEQPEHCAFGSFDAPSEF
jgi:hypothetical protein